MSAKGYFDEAIAALQRVAESQSGAIREAARMLAASIQSGHSLYGFGATHSFILIEEMVYRTGGLMLANPIYPHGMNLAVRPMTSTSRLERLHGLGRELLHTVPLEKGDCLLVASTSGRNPVPIEVAIEGQRLGATVIGITSFAYTDGVSSRHESGRKLRDCCDIAIDNGAPYGDAVAAIPGFPQRVGPLSSVTGCAIVNALVAETVSLLVEAGYEPPVFLSANLDEGDAYNARLLARNAHRIHYL
ncbi:MAG: SIS domain-containing protein [Lentisphaeria bacterium]|nr:SIS domain-containing protein [Lentisphaeria bacterium]